MFSACFTGMLRVHLELLPSCVSHACMVLLWFWGAAFMVLGEGVYGFVGGMVL